MHPGILSRCCRNPIPLHINSFSRHDAAETESAQEKKKDEQRGAHLLHLRAGFQKGGTSRAPHAVSYKGKAVWLFGMRPEICTTVSDPFALHMSLVSGSNG
jgi:hypothetical protein